MLTHFCCWGEAKKRRKTTVIKELGHAQKEKRDVLQL
jgi:hypothetical protein